MSEPLGDYWPWLKELETPLADPIEPVSPQDDRPSVKELIAKHKETIEKVRSELGESEALFEKEKHDDLWILRFCLSHKNKVKDVVKAIKYTLNFRKEHKLDERDIRNEKIMKGHFSDERVSKYFDLCDDDAARFTVPDKQRGVIVYLKLRAIKQHDLVKNLTEDEWLPPFIYVSEWSFQWLDYVTRSTGRLTKSIRLIDFKGMKMMMNSRENMRRDGKVMGIMEDCYPQLLQTLFVCNPPIWIEIPWRLFRPLVPKRVIDKMDFITPAKIEKHRKLLLRHIAEENLPERFGGKQTE